MSTRTYFDVNEVKLTKTNWSNKIITIKNNFLFIDHQNINSNDLWVDRIYLTNSGKTKLVKDFDEKVNEILSHNSNFQRSSIR